MKRRMNISIDSETAEHLKSLADSAHKSMSQWITDAVWEAEYKSTKQKRIMESNGQNNDH